MANKSSVWCAHPCHDELLPNGKKRFWKTGSKPSHPKGKRSMDKELIKFISNHHQAILNGSSEKLSSGDYLCSSCFTKEEHRFILNEDTNMDIGDNQGRVNYKNLDNCSDNQQNSPMDEDYVHVEQDNAKRKLNQVFQYVKVEQIDDIRHANRISNRVDETYTKLQEWNTHRAIRSTQPLDCLVEER